MAKLKGRNVAILVANGFEEVELTEPLRALQEAGATVEIVSPETDSVRGWAETDWGNEIRVDRALSDANADDYDALMLPGGVMNPDHLRKNDDAVRFTRAFFDAGKPVAAICHAPWLLVEADVVRGRELTSYESIRTDLRNAGAKWVDREVVVDNGMVTSRSPDDLPAFNRKMIEEFAEGVHEGQTAGSSQTDAGGFSPGTGQ
ncbi:type 1 glutamine amidotransferase domain-containing protein [soil metagenome]